MNKLLRKISQRVVVVLFAVLILAKFACAEILVVAPHPDDDLLTSAGVIYRALQDGETVTVVYMTNGDYQGPQIGFARQAEAVDGQIRLGMIEEDLIFLGYPDGYLNQIFNDYASSSSSLVTTYNQSTTYGNRGLGHKDYHSFRFGTPANYNRPNIVLDLESIISEHLPEHIYVTSEFDNHSDHSTTYQLLKMALLALHLMDPSYTPSIHKTVVHWNGGTWPNSMDATSYLSEIPNFSTTGLSWTNRESLDVPFPMQSTVYSTNPKYDAIGTHMSQGGVYGFLAQFIHKDEIFWVENFLGTNQPPTANAGYDQTATEGQSVALNGVQSRDPEGESLLFNWMQVSGIPVQLSDPSVASPEFSAPSGLSKDEVLVFELTVFDDQFLSAPDSVSVKIQASTPTSNNIAPFASVSASSENIQYGQQAVKAIDQIVDGYPGDYTREWATTGEGTGAWLRLSWSIPFVVNRIVLFDRPNTYDNILSATVSFSDGSRISIGPLANDGAATEYSFTPRVITSLTLTVTDVSASTGSVGLAEIELFGGPENGPQYSLTANPAPTGGGSVSVSPSKSSYFAEESVTLTAQPSLGYAFSGWSGNLTGAVNPMTITMTQDMVVTANFDIIPGSLTVTPAGALNASGVAGGPFTPASIIYTLQNAGSSSIAWRASATQSWVGLSPTSGSLSPGASIAVTVLIDSLASTLAVGAYSDTVSFENLTNGGGNTSCPVSLAITDPTQLPTNIAPLATVTASSESAQYGQTAVKAVDGVVDGYPGDYTREWATAHQGVGAWISLNWSVPHSVDRIVLYDRPNSDDNIMSATISFSDGSTLSIGPLANNGAATAYSFAPKVITGLTLTVTGVSSSTGSAGLSELEVFAIAGDGPQYSLTVYTAPTGSGSVSVSPSRTSYYAEERLTLTAQPSVGYAFSGWSGNFTGTANPITITMTQDMEVTANFDLIPGSLLVTPADTLTASGMAGGPLSPASIIYTLQNVGGSSIDWRASSMQSWVGFSSTTGSLSPGASIAITVLIDSSASTLAAGAYSDTVSFENLTNGGGNASRSVNLAITDPTQLPTNIAPLATVTASSESAQYGQTAVKAVDGIVDGYPGDYTREWATAHQRVGAWISMNWSASHSVDRIVLYDRPNSDDNITSATISFSDGSSLSIGPLANNGAATAYSFAPKVITGLTMTVTGVNSSTGSVGLSEIEVFGE